MRFDSGCSRDAVSNTIDKKLAAVCGLFCPACTVYIGTTEEPARLEVMAQRMQRPVENCIARDAVRIKDAFFARASAPCRNALLIKG